MIFKSIVWGFVLWLITLAMGNTIGSGKFNKKSIGNWGKLLLTLTLIILTSFFACSNPIFNQPFK